MNYDPFSIDGIKKIDDLHQDVGEQEKMYIQAEVELINDIDESISLQEWNSLIELWKQKIILLAKPQNISPYELDNLLERYYLNTEIPTLDYVYSLCALGASSPKELQLILEAATKEQLLEKCKNLFGN